MHIGNSTVPLTATRKTSPTLAVRINNTISYGALFSDDAPSGTMRFNVDGAVYWLGEYCAPGQYIPAGQFRCADCGMGHYCMGGRHRAVCSGGAIACPGTQATADASAPGLVNRLLTAQEIADNIPATDLSQWQMISCCSGPTHGWTDLYKDLSGVNTYQGCAGGKLEPGTYLFAVRPDGFCAGNTDPISGSESSAFSTNILIADHDISYKSIHDMNVYYHFVDIDGPEFTGWDIKVPAESYCSTTIRTNITGLENVPRSLCVYKLK